MEERETPGVIRLFVYMVAAAGLAGGLNGWISATGAMDWANTLDTPAWTPPSMVIGLVWSGLFQLMAIALWICERRGRQGRRWLAAIFILAQIAASVMWVCVFFGERSIAGGFIATALGWTLSVFSLWAVGRCCRTAGVMMWLVFAWLGAGLVLSFQTLALNAPTGVGL